MINTRSSFRIIVVLLSISILLTGCHSFFEVPKQDYKNLDKMNDIKVVYKSGKEFIVEKDDTTNIKIAGDSLIVTQGTKTKFIGMNEVEKIRESRFDLGGTITLTLIGLTIMVIVFFSNYSPGG